eukprot:gene8316-11250_t
MFIGLVSFSTVAARFVIKNTNKFFGTSFAPFSTKKIHAGNISDIGVDQNDSIINPLQSLCHYIVAMNSYLSNDRSISDVDQEKIIDLMSQVRLNDLGLEPFPQILSRYGLVDEGDIKNNKRFSACMNIISRKEYQIAVFLLKRGCFLPLHDHPSMTVLTKIVAGELRLRSYSKKNNNNQSSGIFSSRIEAIDEGEFVKNETSRGWTLTATDKNYHEIVAMEDSVMLDVFLPPYDSNLDRECNYYRVENISSSSDDQTKKIVNLVSINSASINKYLPFSIPYRGYTPTI